MPIPDFNADPDIRLFGDIHEDMVRDYYKQARRIRNKSGPVILELGTRGGDPEAARRIGMDVEHLRKNHKKEIYFLGKTVVYSAGANLMGCFPQRYRFVTKDTMLLIHERRMEKEVDLVDRPLSACAQIVQQLRAQIENSQNLEKAVFERLAKGVAITAKEVTERAKDNWYLSAGEALRLGLIAGIV
jgi:ATP-dependent Clp protease, protease subunit